MTHPEKFVIVARGSGMEPLTWTRAQLKHAVGLARQTLLSQDGDAAYTAVEVRGDYGEGETLYEAVIERDVLRTLKAVSAVVPLLPTGPKLSPAQQRVLDELRPGESIIVFPGDFRDTGHWTYGTGAGRYRNEASRRVSLSSVRALIDARVLDEHDSFPCDATGRRARMYKVRT